MWSSAITRSQLRTELTYSRGICEGQRRLAGSRTYSLPSGVSPSSFSLDRPWHFPLASSLEAFVSCSLLDSRPTIGPSCVVVPLLVHGGFPLSETYAISQRPTSTHGSSIVSGASSIVSVYLDIDMMLPHILVQILTSSR